MMSNMLMGSQLGSFMNYPQQMQGAMGQIWDVNQHNAGMSQRNKDRDLYAQQMQNQQQLQSQLMRALGGVLGGGSRGGIGGGAGRLTGFSDTNSNQSTNMGRGLRTGQTAVTSTPLQRAEIDQGVNAMRQNESVMPNYPVPTSPDATGQLSQRLGMADKAFNYGNAVEADAGLTAQNADLDRVIRNLQAKLKTGNASAMVGLEEDNARRQVAQANPLIRALGAFA